MSSIAEMRKRLKEKEKKNNVNESVFPFWNMNYGKTAIVRLIPWLDELSQAFWTERKLMNMNFVDPENDARKVFIKAPCLEMYVNDQYCPVLGVVRDLYKREKDVRSKGNVAEAERVKKVASWHWVKPTYYYQGFVIQPGFEEETVPVNPIRELPFTKKIHTVVYSSIMDDDDPLDIIPTGDFTLEDIQAILNDEVAEDQLEDTLKKFEGYNLLLKKTQQGEYADWSSSKFARGEKVMLTDEQIAAINEYGYHDLRKKLPERPTDEQYEVLVKMMEASIAFSLGEGDGTWDPEWEEAGFKPYRPKNSGGDDDSGDDGDGGSSSSSESKSKSSSSSAATNKGASLRDKLKAARGASAATPAAKKEEEEPAKKAEEETSEPEPTEEAPAEVATPKKGDDAGASPTDRASALADRIRQRRQKAAS